MERSLKIIKSIIIAFSLYSRIPVSTFKWEDEEYRHAISFLPLVGIVIGGLCILAAYMMGLIEVPVYIAVAFISAIPLLITGGFHMDGFMDVTDALSSYSDREKSLQIMKDPHIGAFSVLSLITYGLLWFSGMGLVIYAYYETGDMTYIYIFGIFFYLVRGFCAVTSLLFKKGRKDGMLSRETKNPAIADEVFLALQACFGTGLVAAFDFTLGVVVTAVILLFTAYYGWLCNKKFGGVTGDTAGLFIAEGELILLCVLGLYCILKLRMFI